MQLRMTEHEVAPFPPAVNILFKHCPECGKDITLTLKDSTSAVLGGTYYTARYEFKCYDCNKTFIIVEDGVIRK